MTSSFCNQAIAYLKPAMRDEKPALSLSKADSPVLRSISEDLLVAYVVDAGDHLRFVQHRHLEQEGMSTDELHNIAVTNLERLAQEKLTVREYGPIYVALLGGNFEASLLLVNAMWTHWYGHLVQDTFMVAAPARDVLAFCGASSTDGIAELREVVRRVQGGDHRLPPDLYRRVGLEWHKFA